MGQEQTKRGAQKQATHPALHVHFSAETTLPGGGPRLLLEGIKRIVRGAQLTKTKLGRNNFDVTQIHEHVCETLFFLIVCLSKRTLDERSFGGLSLCADPQKAPNHTANQSNKQQEEKQQKH